MVSYFKVRFKTNCALNIYIHTKQRLNLRHIQEPIFEVLVRIILTLKYPKTIYAYR